MCAYLVVFGAHCISTFYKPEDKKFLTVPAIRKMQ